MYQVKNNKVYYNNYIIKKANIKSFKKLKNGFAKDKLGVYYKGELIKLDPKYFQIIKYDYCRDNKKIYTGEYQLKNIDLSTFKVLNRNYSKDKNYFYYGISKIQELNAKQVKIYENYILDDKKVYCGSKEIKACDPKTFEVLGYLKSKDKNYVYDEEDPIPRADPGSFQVLKYKNGEESEYCKDESFIYYQSELIIADPDTFQVLNEYYAKDDFRVFNWGEIIKNADSKSFTIIKDDWGKDKDNIFYGRRKIRPEDLLFENIRDIWFIHPNLSFAQLLSKILNIKDKKFKKISNYDIIQAFSSHNFWIKKDKYYTWPNKYKINWKF